MLTRKATRVCAALLAAAGVLLTATAAHAQCLIYTARVRVEGTLERKLYPGPPEFESIAAGDAPEAVWLLRLDTPMCVAADSGDGSGINAAVTGVDRIQLVLTETQYRAYAPLMGRRTVLTGKLFGAMTAHHRTPVLLDQVQIAR